MNTDNYINLIYKNLKGEISDNEVDQLMSLTAQSEENQTLREEIELAWFISDDSAIPHFDVNADLLKVKQKINQSKTSIKVVKIDNRRYFAIAASFLFLVAAGFWYNSFMGNDQLIYQTAENTEMIKLIDGSQIWLNKNSKLIMDKSFGNNDRNVQMTGEAFFDIARNEKIPFNIQLTNAKVEVLGTSFNIKESSSEIKVEVKSGKVRFSTVGVGVELEKNQVGILQKGKNQIIEETSITTNSDNWRTQRFMFQNRTLDSILKELERRFNSKFDIELLKLKDCELSIIINSNNLEEVVNEICNTLDMTSTKKTDGTYKFVGGNCN